MSQQTQEAPSKNGAYHGDTEAFNQPALSVPDPRGRTTGAIVPASAGRIQTARLKEHNQRVWLWGEQFDPKYRKVVKTLGWMINLDSGYAYFGVATFRQQHKSHGFGEISRRTVFRRFGELEAAGVIKRVHQYRGDGSQRSSRYAVDFSVVIQGGIPVRLGEAAAEVTLDALPVEAVAEAPAVLAPDMPDRPPASPEPMQRAQVTAPAVAAHGPAPLCSRDGCDDYDAGRGFCYPHQAEEDAPPERGGRGKWNRVLDGSGRSRDEDGDDWE